ncbi:MAG: hypothetical protein PHH59_10285 [Methylovulum sp.]|uniref:hypothetical protein n=1 Tax=Methylovulum sp. TaxID=1916980 RepID=UPI0026189311|nr:hypothetical protein [Methylovulum sp.]MDD2724394.1 hypothetical protein [Methylovulum sp.]
MSYKARLIKLAIKCTPKIMVVWGANIVLKGIAELTDFKFDLETRKVYVRTLLNGEVEAIEVWVEDFAMVNDGENYTFIIQQAQSNKLWLTNLLSHIIGRAWKIPVTPQLKSHIELLSELLKAEKPEQKETD